MHCACGRDAVHHVASQGITRNISELADTVGVVVSTVASQQEGDGWIFEPSF